MQLPIAATPSEPAADVLIRYYQHTERLWTEHLAEPTQLDCGTAYVNAQLASVHDANRVLDAALPAGISPAEAIDEVQRHYASAGCRCASWMMNVAAGQSQTQRLVDHLLQEQFQPGHAVVMVLKSAAAMPPRSPFQIIPARASFRHLRTLAEENAARWNTPQLAEASLLHLDDPHWDSFLALDGPRAVGMAGVLVAGNIGRIDEVYVSERDRRRGVGRALMDRVLETCARSLLKHVLLSVREDNRAAMAMYEQFGFVQVGSDLSYHNYQT